MLRRRAVQHALPAFQARDVQREHVVVGAQRLRHLADQLIAHPLEGEFRGRRVESREHVLEDVRERRRLRGRALRPDLLGPRRSIDKRST